MKTSWYRSSVIIALIVLCGMSAAATSAPMTVEVDKVAGKVEVRYGGEWKALAGGDKVPVGAEVRTGAGASCMLKWAGGNIASLQQFTLLKVAEADKSETGAEKSTLDMTEGKIYAHAKKLSTQGSKFNVKTPTAVAGVRGTDFFGEVAGGGTNFAVDEGSLQIEAGGEVVVLDEGLFVSVDETGAISEPAPIPVEIINESKEKFNEVRSEGKQEEEKAVKEEKTEEKKEEKKAADEEKKKEEAKEEKKGTGEQDKGKGAEQGKGIDKQEEKESAKGTEEKPGEAKEETAGETGEEPKETDAAEAGAGAEVEAEAGIETDTGAGAEPEAGIDIADAEIGVEPEIDVGIDDVIDTVVDQVLENQTTNDIIAAAEALIESGTVRVIVNIESQ